MDHSPSATQSGVSPVDGVVRAAKRDPLAMADRGKGCLVKIHPMDVHGGLIHVRDEGFVIGRDETCHEVIRDEAVSRRHALLEHTEAGYIVTDLGSTNGTYVNDRRITSQLLMTGDRLRLANHIFKFLSSDHIEAQYHETVYSMMTKDGLTGAYNKRYFLEVLDRELERCRRFSRPVSLIMFDIDHFKSINDEHGHLAGDEVLAALGARVLNFVRRDEVFARYGGEEFAMVLGETPLEGAMTLAERLRALIADQTFATTRAVVQVTISAGVAAKLPSESLSPIQLIEAADRRLYHAKQAGRNRVCDSP